VTVESNDIYFEPAELTISADTDVTVSLPNAGAAPHNFSIDKLGISVDIAPGATEETTINAPAGTYEYYCNAPGHKQAGMVGTLIISEDAAAAPADATPVPAAAEQDAAAGDATPTRATTQATPAAGVEQAAGAGAGRMQEPPDRRLAG
jgi:heme/copper-type cytochrome/quinol oxidase subunit 2